MLPNQTEAVSAGESRIPAARPRRLPPAWIAAALYASVSLGIVIASWYAADHHFIYPLDDSYISMAMAKNLALHGVWGVSRYGFSSSDSSLLYPLLLAAAYRIAGVNDYAPAILSWIFGLLSIFAAQHILAPFVSRRVLLWTLIALVLLPPLFVIGLIGMEHTLHLLLTLLFLGYFLRFAAGEDEPERLWKTGAITALMVAARYEGLFLVAPACCILLFYRRWKAALTLLAGAALPVGAYAAYSLAHGGYWLPNSVSLKGAESRHASVFGAVHDVLARVALNTQAGIHVPLLLVAMAVAALALIPRSTRRALPLLLVLAAGCLHMGLASVGWAFRYEDYLIGAAIVAIAYTASWLRHAARQRMFVTAYFLFLAAAAALGLRSVAAAHLLPACSRCIYLQQWQMAHFLHRYYPQAGVAANDIGAIDYYNEIHCFDLLGLANQKVFTARRHGAYSTAVLARDSAADHVQIAIVYDDVFGTHREKLLVGPKLPPAWIRVGRWSIRGPVALVERTVSFYGVDPDEASRLRSALAAYQGSLPDGVAASGP